MRGRAVGRRTGNAVNTYVYDPYGNHLAGTTEAVANPWQFAGGFRDAFSSYYKFGTRYYDPTIGRWIQPDPSGLEANNYLYAAANPVNFVDPTGELSCDNNKVCRVARNAGSKVWESAKSAGQKGAKLAEAAAPYVDRGFSCFAGSIDFLNDAADAAVAAALLGFGASTANPALVLAGAGLAGYASYNIAHSYPKAARACGVAPHYVGGVV